MKLSENEKALYAELVVQIAFRMCDSSYFTEGRLPCEERPDFLGCVIQRGATSCLEAGCGVLYGIGALQPLNMDLTPREEEPQLAHCYRLKVGAVGLSEHVAGALPASAPSLSEVIEAFLALICGYSYGVHSRREAFAVPPVFERAFDLFERCGYVERDGDEVKWTDKIAPEMRAACEWTEDLVSWEEVEDAAVEEIWRTMPPRFREMFFPGGPVDVISLTLVISEFWDGGGNWRDTARHADNPEYFAYLDGRAMGLANKLEKKFRESGE